MRYLASLVTKLHTGFVKATCSKIVCLAVSLLSLKSKETMGFDEKFYRVLICILHNFMFLNRINPNQSIPLSLISMLIEVKNAILNRYDNDNILNLLLRIDIVSSLKLL